MSTSLSRSSPSCFCSSSEKQLGLWPFGFAERRFSFWKILTQLQIVCDRITKIFDNSFWRNLLIQICIYCFGSYFFRCKFHSIFIEHFYKNKNLKCSNGRRINHGNIAFYLLFCSKRCKDITKKLHSCSNERSVCGLCRIFHTFQVFHSAIVRVLLPSWHSLWLHARKFFSVAGDWQNF